MFAGILTIYGGLAVVAVGAVSVAVFVRTSLKVEQTPRKPVVRQAFTIGGLLLLNFPVAAAIIASVIYMET